MFLFLTVLNFCSHSHGAFGDATESELIMEVMQIKHCWEALKGLDARLVTDKHL